MIVILFGTIVLLIVVVLVAIPLMAPEGYEDASGFHYGKDERK